MLESSEETEAAAPSVMELCLLDAPYYGVF